jgi:hypothetical protein
MNESIRCLERDLAAIQRRLADMRKRREECLREVAMLDGYIENGEKTRDDLGDAIRVLKKAA